jgi:hypothetical protein
MATSFSEMAIEGVNYFQSLFKEESRETIVVVIRLANLFPSFVNPKDNQELMVEVGKEELL